MFHLMIFPCTIWFIHGPYSHIMLYMSEVDTWMIYIYIYIYIYRERERERI